MYNELNEECKKILLKAKDEMILLKHPYVGSEHLLLAILKEKNYVTSKLKKYDVTYSKFRKQLIDTVGIGKSESKWFLYTPLLRRVIENAIEDCKEQGIDVNVESLFSSILEEGDGVAIRLLIAMNVDLESLSDEIIYKIYKKSPSKTLLIDELGENLTYKADIYDPVIGRDNEIKRIIEILSRRTKNNPLLIGEAGVGKTAIVEELSRLIKNNEVPYNLRNKKIISVDMASLVAGTKYRGEFEDRLKKLILEIENNDDIILFIDEIHTLVGAGGAEGAIDASNIFKPALARNKLKCIGATTFSEYKQFIENDKALDRRFQKIIIDIPKDSVVKNILKNLKPIYENYHKVIVPDILLDKIISLSNKYIHNQNQPDKAIDILDEACTLVRLKEDPKQKKYNQLNKDLNHVELDIKKAIKNNDYKQANIYKEQEFILMNELNNLELELLNKKKTMTLEDVATIITSKTNIPIYEAMNKYDASKFELIKSNIIGQDEACNELISIAKKIQLGFKEDKCSSFLFAGPTGVGKTYLATLFGKCFNNNVIRLDMSEYSEPHSVSKIVGAPPGYIGYKDNKTILDEIKNNPFSVIILDEIERANKSVINLFFQILDNGKIKNSKGEFIYFNNSIIIMTSNVGFEDYNVGFSKNNDNITKLKEYFSLPFLNRIDNTIIFKRLSNDDIKKLTLIKLKNIKKKYKNRINIRIKENVVNEIIELSNYKEYGARKIDKIIENKIENIIIDKIINDKKTAIINSLDLVKN